MRQKLAVGTPPWTDMIYASGSMIGEVPGTQTATPVYRLPDHLGSLAAQTNGSGGVTGANVFLPYGEMLTSTTSDSFQFTGLPQDTENSSYHAGYRNFSTTQGRWLSPDPYNGSYDITNPQSFNRYSYVMNNPLSFVDPTGLNQKGPGSGGCDPNQMDCGADLPDGPGQYYGTCTSFTDGGGPTGDYSSIVIGTPTTCNFYGTGLGDYLPTVGLQIGWSETVSGTVDAPNNATPWYQNTCVTSALLKGAGSTALDAVGLIPEGGAVSALFSGFNGAAGISNGTRILQGVKMGGGIIGTASAGSNGSGLSTGLGVLGIAATLGKAAPGVGQIISGASMVVDIYQTAEAVGKCN
ncbi:MAG: RHS repeat-associated core domain-containing protein [Acidobacteriaceae bacterium]